MHRLAKYSAILCMGLWAIAFAPPGSANLGESDSQVTDDVNFVEGKKAVDAQDWNKAVEWLTKAAQSQPQNADVHNYLGYAYRKTGNFPAAFSHYNEALKLNPKHKHAHEYIGEAYLLTDDLFKAEYHLSELQRICSPIPCEEYKDLKRAVESYKKTRK